MKRFIFLLCVIGALCAPAFAYAATLSFTSEHTTVGIGSPFDVEVTLDTTNEVNAIGVAISLPPGIELVKTNNGNSVVSYWIEQPQFNSTTRILTFSGIMPNGLSGTQRILVLTLRANTLGTYALSFDPAYTALYQNGPSGILEPTTSIPLTLYAVSGTTSTTMPTTDTSPPEAFTPVVTRNAQLYDGAWTLIFATQDKGSGVAYYEVSESPLSVFDTDTLSWTKTESPYKLADQTLSSYMYVRVVDEQGNVRTELYTPAWRFSWFEGLALGILVMGLVLFVFRLWRKKHHYASL